MASYTVRPIASCEEFRLPGAPSVDVPLRRSLERGATRLEWCFVLARDGVDVGRVAFQAQPTCPPEFLGRLPEREVYPVGLWLPWDDPGHVDMGRCLFAAARESAGRELLDRLQAMVNVGLHDHPAERRRLFESIGMTLFQEKQGYGWQPADDPPVGPLRLSFQTIDEAGRDRYHAALGRIVEGTLDRNDAWYRDLAGQENWASVIMTLLRPADAPGWLLATSPEGDTAGIVAVSAFKDATATITIVGVVPEHRGRGYIDDLLRAGTAAALRAGFTSMLSDADVLNGPMTGAFARNGHRADARPWHKWHYRF
jgi:GNAT superfamily N-acetyltransferase